MNTSLLRHPFRSMAIAAALCCAAEAPAVAQSTADSPAAPKVGPYAPNLNARLDFDFPLDKDWQMTPLSVVLDLFVKEFRAAGNPVNVIYDDQSPDGKPEPSGRPAHVLVPPMSLRQVTFMTAMSAVRAAAKPGLIFEGSDDMLIVRNVTPADLLPARRFSAFNVKEFLMREGGAAEKRKERLRTLQRAISIAIDLTQVEIPKLEVDDESGLLFVSGKAESIEVIGQVVSAATAGASTPAPTVPATLPGIPVLPRIPALPAPPALPAGPPAKP